MPIPYKFFLKISMKSIKITRAAVLTSALCCSLVTSSVYAQSTPTSAIETTPVTTSNTLTETTSDVGWWTSQPKEKKLLYTNVIAASLIGIWGLAEWDYGSASWHDADEGWFEQDSKYGGADKAGHFWATYTFSDALTGLYKHWGYDSRRASTYAAWSAWGVQAFMEMADATSETQGFSWEDMAMNTAGALTSVLMERYPGLDRKIDFRVEYVFNVDINGIFDDYSNQYYSMVLKLDGFDSIENTMLKYLELSAGYYTRGYDDDEEDDERFLYAGVSLNFARLFHQNGWTKTGKTLEYIDIPYSVLKASHGLD
ncbi:MAG: VanZ family protein [Desulforhopalus sp.]